MSCGFLRALRFALPHLIPLSKNILAGQGDGVTRLYSITITPTGVWGPNPLCSLHVS